MRKEEQLVLGIAWEGMRRLAIGYDGGGTPLRRWGCNNLLEVNMAISWDKMEQLALGWRGSMSKNKGVASQGKVVTGGKPARRKEEEFVRNWAVGRLPGRQRRETLEALVRR